MVSGVGHTCCTPPALSGPAALPANGAVAALLARSSCGYAMQPAPRATGPIGGLHLRHALHHPLRGASRRGQSARRGGRQGQTAACQAATGRIPGVSQDPHVSDTVFLGALRMERPSRIPLRRPVTTATRPPRSFSSRRLKVPTCPHIHRSGHPPPPHPHPPLPPPALRGYLDEASASFRVDFSMRHLAGHQEHGHEEIPSLHQNRKNSMLRWCSYGWTWLLISDIVAGS